MIDQSLPQAHLCSSHPTSSEVERILRDIKMNHHDFMSVEMRDLKQRLYTLAKGYSANSHATQLAKLFDRFARDFTRHMDTEEQVLFPLILAQLHGEARDFKSQISETVLEKIATEDQVVGSEFGRILALAELLSRRSACGEYDEVLTKLREIEMNLTEHTEKERHFVAPFVAEYLKYRSNEPTAEAKSLQH